MNVFLAVLAFVAVIGLIALPVWAGMWLLLRWLNRPQASPRGHELAPMAKSPAAPLTEQEQDQAFAGAAELFRRGR
jgi:hypothetical protein